MIWKKIPPCVLLVIWVGTTHYVKQRIITIWYLNSTFATEYIKYKFKLQIKLSFHLPRLQFCMYVCTQFLQDCNHYFILRTLGRIIFLSRTICRMFSCFYSALYIHIPAQIHIKTRAKMNRTLDAFKLHWKNWRRKYLHSEAYFYLLDYFLPSAFL